MKKEVISRGIKSWRSKILSKEIREVKTTINKNIQKFLRVLI